MLIPLDGLVDYFKLNITGVLHVGAHVCEEQKYYLNKGVVNENIYWIEAMNDKVELMKSKNKDLNIFQAVIDIVDDKEVEFNVADNGQSSSILEFGTHSKHHPHVKMINKVKLTTTRLDTFIKKNRVPIERLNFMNLDIQGKELDALKSMDNYIQYVKYIYTEVNTEKVYKDCGLLSEIDDYLKEKGFVRVTCRIYSENGKSCGWGDAFYMRV